MDGYDFSYVLMLLRAGKRIARSGWNGKGMWLVLVKAEMYAVATPAVAGLELLPWIGMKTADNRLVPWLASQSDLLAMDWEVVE